MEIYVQSAGISEEHDYCWQKVDTPGRVDEPDLVKYFKYLLQTESPSILIGYKKNHLILLITGMKADRKDYRGRTIRNSVAFISQDNPDEQRKIRDIAVHALREEKELSTVINSFIISGGKYGFNFDFQEQETGKNDYLLKKIPSIGRKDSKNYNEKNKQKLMIGKNSEENKIAIAFDLEHIELSELMEGSEALVVVTGIKAEDTLKKAGVWRGLSNLVAKAELSSYVKKSNINDESKNLQKQFFETETIVLYGLMFVIVISLFFFFYKLLPVDLNSQVNTVDKH